MSSEKRKNSNQNNRKSSTDRRYNSSLSMISRPVACAQNLMNAVSREAKIVSVDGVKIGSGAGALVGGLASVDILVC